MGEESEEQGEDDEVSQLPRRAADRDPLLQLGAHHGRPLPKLQKQATTSGDDNSYAGRDL